MKRLIQFGMITLAVILFFVTACQETDEYAQATSGKLVVKLTDAPFPVDLVEKAMVTIDKIEIRSTTDSLRDKFIVLSEKTQQFDLLDLQNGITADLLEMQIDTGSYDLIRMHVVEGKVTLKDGTTFNLKIPGGSASGLKIRIEPALVVEGGVTNEVLLDFDVSKSFTVQGNVKSKNGIKGFIFKPVIRAVGQAQCGSVKGKVTDSAGAAIEQASVQIMSGDSVLTSSLTDKQGEYVMIGIPAGTYQMVCEKEGYTSATADGVKVEAKRRTTQNFTLK